MNPFGHHLSKPQIAQIRKRLNRREFLLQALLAGTVSAFAPRLMATQLPAHIDVSVLNEQPWQTLSVVQLHLFPQDGNGPGALDIEALAYLYQALKRDDPDTRDFIIRGVGWLDDAALQETGKSFQQNKYDQREQLLQLIAKSETGENWLAYLMTYIVEALLADPVYGGNPEGVGWRWLQHQPGYPRPPKHKRYMDLG